MSGLCASFSIPRSCRFLWAALSALFRVVSRHQRIFEVHLLASSRLPASSRLRSYAEPAVAGRSCSGGLAGPARASSLDGSPAPIALDGFSGSGLGWGEGEGAGGELKPHSCYAIITMLVI